MNEKDCAEVLSQLVGGHFLQDVYPILGSDSFSTLDRLVSLAQEFLQFSGGRLTSHELQSYLNVDMHYIDKIIQKMLSEDNTLQFLGGELISQHYVESLVIDISQLIRRHQRKCHNSNLESQQTQPPLRIGTLVTQFRLPLDTMTTLVKTHFPNEKSFFSSTLASSALSSNENEKKTLKKKKKKDILTNEDTPAPSINKSNSDTSCVSSFQRQTAKAAVYGYCLGSVLPVPLSSILSAVEASGLTDEAGVLSVLQDMTTQSTLNHVLGASSYQLPGTCNNKEYIPHIFSNQQRIQVDDYFRNNNLISFAYLQSLHIQSKQLEYMKSSFNNAIALETCIISGSLQELFISSIEEVTSAFPFPIGTSNSGGNACPPWLNLACALPTELTELDIETLLKTCGADLNSKSCNVSLITTANSTRDNECYLLNNQFLQSLRGVLATDASSAATVESMAISALLETKKSSQNGAVGPRTGLASISTSTSAKLGLASTLYDDDGAGRGKKGKNKKPSKATRNALLEEEPPAELYSKSNKKGGKRGKDKEQLTSSSSADHTSHSISTSSSSVAALDQSINHQSDMIATLIAPFVAPSRLIELFLKTCPLTMTEVEEALDTLSKCKSNNNDYSNCDSNYEDDISISTILPLFEAISMQLYTSATKVYTQAAEQALLSTTQGTRDTQMKRELTRDQKFEEYWTNLQVASKVILSFEKDCTPDTPFYDQLWQVHSFLLVTKCVPIAVLLTEFCCWEHDIECPLLPETQTSLSFEQRRQLQKDLPQEIGNLLSKLWKSLGTQDQQGSPDTTSTVWNFMDIISSSTFKETFNLIVHKIDKKKEKSLSFAFKQQLMDSLKTEVDPQKVCPLVLSLAVYQLTSSVLELPRTSAFIDGEDKSVASAIPSSEAVVSFLLAWLSPPRISPEDFEAIAALRTITTSSSASIETAKHAVLNMKKPSPSAS